jgi:hypothetical protein
MVKAIASKGFAPGNSSYGFCLGQYFKVSDITVKHFTVLLECVEYSNACAALA